MNLLAGWGFSSPNKGDKSNQEPKPETRPRPEKKKKVAKPQSKRLTPPQSKQVRKDLETPYPPIVPKGSCIALSDFTKKRSKDLTVKDLLMYVLVDLCNYGIEAFNEIVKLNNQDLLDTKLENENQRNNAIRSLKIPTVKSIALIGFAHNLLELVKNSEKQSHKAQTDVLKPNGV